MRSYQQTDKSIAAFFAYDALHDPLFIEKLRYTVCTCDRIRESLRVFLIRLRTNCVRPPRRIYNTYIYSVQSVSWISYIRRRNEMWRKRQDVTVDEFFLLEKIIYHYSIIYTVFLFCTTNVWNVKNSKGKYCNTIYELNIVIAKRLS